MVTIEFINASLTHLHIGNPETFVLTMYNLYGIIKPMTMDLTTTTEYGGKPRRSAIHPIKKQSEKITADPI